MSSPLFQPCSLGALSLKNRWAMAPMTRNRSPGGVPDATVAEYYRRRAAGGVGLIITEGALIDHPLAGAYGPTIPTLRDETVSGWQQVIAVCAAHQTPVFAQVWHCGPVVAGGLSATNATAKDRADLLASYARAVSNVVRAGFAGLELHAAHGYLLDSFLRAGDVEFVAEVVRQTRAQVGPSFPICLRFSTWKVGDYAARYIESAAHLESILLPLKAAGVDWFHPSVRRFWEPAFADGPTTLAAWTKKISGAPTLIVGNIGLDPARFAGEGPEGLAALTARFHAGEFDLAVVGRPLIPDPLWPEKIAAGRHADIIPFTTEAASRSIYP